MRVRDVCARGLHQPAQPHKVSDHLCQAAAGARVQLLSAADASIVKNQMPTKFNRFLQSLGREPLLSTVVVRLWGQTLAETTVTPPRLRGAACCLRAAGPGKDRTQDTDSRGRRNLRGCRRHAVRAAAQATHGAGRRRHGTHVTRCHAGSGAGAHAERAAVRAPHCTTAAHAQHACVRGYPLPGEMRVALRPLA